MNLIGVLDYLICIPRPLAWGRLSFKDAAKIQQKFEIHKLFCIFCIFATYRTFGDYVSPAGPQYDKERLITILRCKGTTKKRKAQRFDPLRPNKP